MHRISFLAIGFLLQYIICQSPDYSFDKINQLKINQFQVIGSHNSYRLRMDENIFRWLSRFDSGVAEDLDYSHYTLEEQFSQFGIRQIELDIYYDPDGGLFNKRMGNSVSKNPVRPNFPELMEPGLKILHFPDIDFNTNYLTFKHALSVIKKWSNEHPNHFPIFILIEAKDDGVTDKNSFLSLFGFVRPLEFDMDALNTIDDEICEVFGNNLEGVITPDDVRGNSQSLENVILNEGWPTLGESRGKVMFGLDNQGKVMTDYIVGHSGLKDRIMFVEANPGTPEAAFIGMNTPNSEIAKRVQQGYLVRTRADTDTRQARSGNSTRRNTALASGAHFISTDYYTPDSRHKTSSEWTDYTVTLPGKVSVRINPVNGPSELNGMNIE